LNQRQRLRVRGRAQRKYTNVFVFQGTNNGAPPPLVLDPAAFSTHCFYERDQRIHHNYGTIFSVSTNGSSQRWTRLTGQTGDPSASGGGSQWLLLRRHFVRATSDWDVFACPRDRGATLFSFNAPMAPSRSRTGVELGRNFYGTTYEGGSNGWARCFNSILHGARSIRWLPSRSPTARFLWADTRQQQFGGHNNRCGNNNYGAVFTSPRQGRSVWWLPSTSTTAPIQWPCCWAPMASLRHTVQAGHTD